MVAGHFRDWKDNARLFVILISVILAGWFVVLGIEAVLSSEHFGTKFSKFIFAGLLGLTMNIWYSLNGQEWASADNQRFVALIIPPAVLTITWVISSNLALSLGMIGALSIVRFRNPVKSPFELTTFFVYIVIGVAAGVDIRYATMIWAFAMMSPLIVWISNQFTTKGLNPAGQTSGGYIAHFKIQGRVEILLKALVNHKDSVLSIGQQNVEEETVQLVMLVDGVEKYTEIKSVIEQCSSVISEDLQSSF